MRRLVTLAVLVSLGAALIVSTAFAQSQSQGKEGAKDYNRQGLKLLVQDSSDSTLYTIGMDGTGHGFTVVDKNSPSLTYLTPMSIYAGTIAVGASDTTSIVNLSAYKSVALLFQVTSNGVNDWQRFAVNARFNMNGESDSLSLFTIPVQAYDDSVATILAASRVAVPTAAVCGAGEFPVTVPLTTGGGAAASNSLPQGKIVWLTVPAGFVWPSNCSFRIRNIAREGAAVSPTLHVWVMGTAL